MKELAGKTAFITGGASGIGLGIANALVAAGVKVMLCDIDEPSLTEAVKALQSAGGDVAGVTADVSLKSDLQEAAHATSARFGKLHILVNNAGVAGGERYGRWQDMTWAWMVEVNLMSVVRGIEVLAPLIEQHGEGGHIVSTASMAGLIPAGSGPYSVTKYGVVALSEGLRPELAPRGIGVSVLCPGFVRTRIADGDRSRPARFGGPAAVVSALNKPSKLRGGIASGIDPNYVGELVCEGIEKNWPYIFTETEFENTVKARFDEIKRGFDRIRDRIPRL